LVINRRSFLFYLKRILIVFLKTIYASFLLTLIFTEEGKRRWRDMLKRKE